MSMSLTLVFLVFTAGGGLIGSKSSKYACANSSAQVSRWLGSMAKHPCNSNENNKSICYPILLRRVKNNAQNEYEYVMISVLVSFLLTTWKIKKLSTSEFWEKKTCYLYFNRPFGLPKILHDLKTLTVILQTKMAIHTFMKLMAWFGKYLNFDSKGSWKKAK